MGAAPGARIQLQLRQPGFNKIGILVGQCVQQRRGVARHSRSRKGHRGQRHEGGVAAACIGDTAQMLLPRTVPERHRYAATVRGSVASSPRTARMLA
ncbi:hypothetical protein RAN3_3564 [plant metagenome]|uniref:Uncharacterized protein n=1 Tax=plant metagenome TaxID=1297885 RepID=A0A484UM14_9ZZZZ